jgi:RHS repeat-associated protein
MNLFRASHKIQVIRPQNPYFSNLSCGVCLQNTYDYSPFGVSLDGRTMESNFYRLGFNGMEKDDEVKGKGNSYDFGARINDPRVGRWLSIDPAFQKYPSFSNYSIMMNNCITNIDSEGKIVKLYDSDGSLVATISKGKTIIEKGKEQSVILQSYKQVKNYFSEETSVFNDMENDEKILEIQYTIRPIGGGSFSPKLLFKDLNSNKNLDEGEFNTVRNNGNIIGRINWDFNQAMTDNQGNNHSPAMILLHEIFHAEGFKNNPIGYIKGLNNKNGIPPKMGNHEENRVINLVNQISQKMKNNDGDSSGKKRLDHEYKKFFVVPSPTSNYEIYKVPDKSIDNTRVNKPIYFYHVH